MHQSKHQSFTAKSGEINFRSQLVKQHLDNELLFPNEYTASQMHQEFLTKLDRHTHDFLKLRRLGVLTTPFLEIGSGYGQTSLMLTNDFNLTGFATDLSPQPLLSINKVANQLHYTKLPTLLICDAETLPFPDNSLPFVFCYQTLHHFPSPEPVIAEIHRVLTPGGYFFFGEEPVSQSFNLNLWRRPTKLRWWEHLLKFTGLLHFISRIGKTEVDRHIHEETFSLSDWSTSLARFNPVFTKLQPFALGPTGSLEHFTLLNRLFMSIMGGGIGGLFQKPLGGNKHKPLLACPTCPTRPKLHILFCPHCHTRYKTHLKTPLLLPPEISRYVTS